MRDAMTMSAMRADDHVFFLQCGADTGGDRFLAHRRMEVPAYLAFAVQLDTTAFKGTDPTDRPEKKQSTAKTQRTRSLRKLSLSGERAESDRFCPPEADSSRGLVAFRRM